MQNSKMRKVLLFFIPVSLLVLAGCVDMTVEWQIDDNGDLSSTLYVTPDSMYEEEASLILNLGSLGLVPFWPSIDTDFQDSTYTITPITKISIEELRQKTKLNVYFDNNMFKLTIPQLYYDVYDKDTVVLTLKVTFPRPVKIANSVDIEANTVTWRITKGMLTKDVVLQAILQ